MEKLTIIGGQRIFGEFSGVNLISSQKFLKTNSKIQTKNLIFAVSPYLIAKHQNSPLTNNLLKLVIERLRKVSFERIIFLSSASVYGLSKHTDSFKESDRLLGESRYAKEKILLEQELKNICQKSGSLFSILRISGMYASKKLNWKKDNLIDQISQNICSNEPRTWEITDGGVQIRDFCSLEFFRLAIEKIIDLDFNDNSTFNLSSTDPIQLKVALSLISKKHNYLSFELAQKINTKIHNSLDCNNFYTKFPELWKSRKTLEQLVDEITNA